jgi:hypothetical protein
MKGNMSIDGVCLMNELLETNRTRPWVLRIIQYLVNLQDTSQCVITKEESLCYLATSDDLPFYKCVLITTHCEP